jgi:hypothetical protein
MSSDLERALSKLRFDDQVLGYSLMTNAGRPFVSFSFPDELFPRVKDSISLYKSDLRLMTIDTEKGLVVLSPVDEHWILTVLYVPELQLGLAIAKTKNVLRMLEGIELPPPPDEFEESAEGNLQVLESIGIQAASTTSEAPAVEEPITSESEPEIEPDEAPAEERSPDDFRVTPSTIPKRGPAYATSLSLDSELSSEMKKTYRNFGFDVLMLVDGNVSISQIADSMFQSTERVIECIKWAASKNIVDVPVIEAEDGKGAGAGTMGQFVKCPKFEGDLSKVKDTEKDILELCDGTRTTEEVAEAAGVQKQLVINVLARYRKNVSMIGKTV